MVIKLYKDVLERALWTAIQVFLSLWIVADLESIQTAAVAALAAGLSVVKSYATSKIGDKDSVSLFSE
jgi:hypothetical protein